MVDVMSARMASNSLISRKSSSEAPCKDVAVSTDNGVRLDGLISPRSTENADSNTGCGAGCVSDCNYSQKKRERIRRTEWIEKVSESDLKMLMSSYSGTPRSLFSENKLETPISEETNVDLKEAVGFLHSDNIFLEAAELGDESSVAALLSRDDTNIHQLDQLGRNALHLAVCSGNVNVIEMLLKAGINPNVKDNVGMTPLSLCLIRNPSLKIATILFNYGAVILPRLGPMSTELFIQFVLMCTPTEEDEQLLELLVKKGAVINDPLAPGGRQALHIAAMGNNCRLIEKLVALGAKLNLKNHMGETPRDFAVLFKCKEAAALLEKLEEASESSSSSESSQSSAESIVNAKTNSNRKVTIVDKIQEDWRQFTSKK